MKIKIKNLEENENLKEFFFLVLRTAGEGESLEHYFATHIVISLYNKIGKKTLFFQKEYTINLDTPTALACIVLHRHLPDFMLHQIHPNVANLIN